MSGFVSKISAAGSKGWTGLQSLWDRDNKTPLNSSPSGPPPEKTSLLSFSLPSRHPKGSRLLSEDDDWADTQPSTDDDNDQLHDQQKKTEDNSAGDGDASFSFPSPPSTTASPPLTLTPTPASTTTNSTKSSPRSQPKVERERPRPERPLPQHPEWSSVSEDENDIWLKADSAHRGILDTDKKKSTRDSKRPSPRFKHKFSSSSSASSSSSSSSSKGGDPWKQDRGGFGSALGKLGKGPAFGKLLDLDCEEEEEREEEERRGGGGGASLSSSSATGCDNQVWANDDDDGNDFQWKMMGKC